MDEYADGPVYGQQSKAVRGSLLRKREGALMEWGGAEDLRDCGLSRFGDPLDFGMSFGLTASLSFSHPRTIVLPYHCTCIRSPRPLGALWLRLPDDLHVHPPPLLCTVDPCSPSLLSSDKHLLVPLVEEVGPRRGPLHDQLRYLRHHRLRGRPCPQLLRVE